MLTSPRFPSRYRAAVAGLALTGTVLALTAGPAAAADGPAAYAYGAQVLVSDQVVVPPTPSATVVAPVGDDSTTQIDIPADPVAVSGTLTATANVHGTADIDSGLTVVDQELAGPYDARSLAEVENLGIVYDVAGQDVALVSAGLVRAEAVAVCSPTPTFSATSEIVDLDIAGSDVPVNAPVQDLIDGITEALAATGLNAIVDVQRNVVNQIPGGGIAVDALVVTILSAAGDPPLATVTIAHAEISAAACAPECSDAVDNDGDAAIDTADPGCHTDGDAGNAATYDPADDSEADLPECSDAADNDADAAIDAADPGCHTDGNAGNAATYDPADDDERDSAALGAVSAGELPRTGATPMTALIGAGALALALAAVTLRRRSLLG